jgi:hypothetical protein
VGIAVTHTNISLGNAYAFVAISTREPDSRQRNRAAKLSVTEKHWSAFLRTISMIFLLNEQRKYCAIERGISLNDFVIAAI